MLLRRPHTFPAQFLRCIALAAVIKLAPLTKPDCSGCFQATATPGHGFADAVSGMVDIGNNLLGGSTA